MLFPCGPERCVVGSVVRNAPQPLPVSFADRDGERFCAFDCLHCTSVGRIKQVISAPSTAQELRDCKQRGKKRFFTRCPLISCRFRSIPLAFRHSLKALFPCAPHCTVAEDVVKTLPGPCRLKTQAKTRKRFCLDCPHCNFAGKMKHSFLCRTRLRNWGAVNKKGDLK